MNRKRPRVRHRLGKHIGLLNRAKRGRKVPSGDRPDLLRQIRGPHHQDRRFDIRLPKFNAFRNRRHPQPRCPRFKRRVRNRNSPVTIGVSFHNGHKIGLGSE